jgi:NAD kinase
MEKDSECESVYHKIQDYDNKNSKTDLCITVGGDGTVLWCNYLFGLVHRPPFLTFNMGTLGYLAYYNSLLHKELIENILNNPKNELIMEKRSMLVYKRITKKDILSKDNKNQTSEGEEGVALNDLVINRDSLRATILDIYLNNNYMTTIRSDGIIISTSTGSTAYSLSSGGSIVHYDVDCLLMTAICPHSLSFRPIVFPKDLRLQIVLNETSPSQAHYTNDGLTKYMMDIDEGVEVSTSDNYLNIIVLEKYLASPLKLWMAKLTEQLGWNTAFKNIG